MTIGFESRCINVFDDVNSFNVDEIQEFYNNADIKLNNKLPIMSFEDSLSIQSTLSNVEDFSDTQITNHIKRKTMFFHIE